MVECSYDSFEKYKLIIEPIRVEAKRLGYAIGLHGTLKRDIDLIACPWAKHAVEPAELAEAVRIVAESILGYAKPHPLEQSEWFMGGMPRCKPFGRLSWSFHLTEKCNGAYIDLSVMPKLDLPPRER